MSLGIALRSLSNAYLDSLGLPRLAVGRSSRIPPAVPCSAFRAGVSRTSMVPTLVFPSSTGGGTFAGVTYDPNLNYIFVNDKDLGTIAVLEPQTSSHKFESLDCYPISTAIL